MLAPLVTSIMSPDQGGSVMSHNRGRSENPQNFEAKIAKANNKVTLEEPPNIH